MIKKKIGYFTVIVLTLRSYYHLLAEGTSPPEMRHSFRRMQPSNVAQYMRSIPLSSNSLLETPVIQFPCHTNTYTSKRRQVIVYDLPQDGQAYPASTACFEPRTKTS